MPPAHEVYATQLWALGYGHPLWGPEPSTQYGEIRIGDIGYLKAGYFFFLFNCMLDEEDTVNSHLGIPPNFQVFRPPNRLAPRFCPDHITQSQLHSRSIRALSVSGGVSARCVVIERTGSFLSVMNGTVNRLLEHPERWG